MKYNVSFEYELLNGEEELEEPFQKLLAAAREAVKISYAPYSRFHVGAALLLSSGEIVKGSNQENASSPAGICAERVALSAASSLFPLQKITAIAVTYHNESAEEGTDNIVSPCGICRQSLLEATDRQQSPVRVILASPSGKVIVLENAAHFLPLAFSAADL